MGDPLSSYIYFYLNRSDKRCQFLRLTAKKVSAGRAGRLYNNSGQSWIFKAETDIFDQNG
jgi:hypothetical protein